MSVSTKKTLYYRLKQTILTWIENGEYPPGSLLPSESQLQKNFNISRTTVRLALKELTQEGYLVRRPGKGTFIAQMKLESGPRRLLSFTQEMGALGYQVKNQVVSVDRELPAMKTADKLQISSNQAVWRVERVRLANGKPIVTEVNYFPTTIVPHPCEGRYYECYLEVY